MRSSEQRKRRRGDRSQMTPKQLAQSDFMIAFWDDPKRHRRISIAYRLGWGEYRRDPRYPALLAALKDTLNEQK